MIVYEIIGIPFDGPDSSFGCYIDKYTAEVMLDDIENSDQFSNNYLSIYIKEVKVNTERI